MVDDRDACYQPICLVDSRREERTRPVLYETLTGRLGQVAELVHLVCVNCQLDAAQCAIRAFAPAERNVAVASRPKLRSPVYISRVAARPVVTKRCPWF